MTESPGSALAEPERQDLVCQVIDRLCLDDGAMERLESFRSDVYLYERGGERSIVKLFHWRHRTAQEIEAELWWLFFLQSQGISVSLPLPSPGGRLIEAFDTSWGPYYAVRYEYAAGRALRWSDVTEEIAEAWGEMTGRLHALSVAYGKFLPPRRTWIEEANYDLRVFGQEHEAEGLAAASLIREVMTLPRTIRNFGLIHADLHLGNLHLDGGGFVVFDADSSVYHWYLYDFAVILHEIDKLDKGRDARQAFAEFFLGAALRGYRRSSNLPISGLDPVHSLELLLELEQLGGIVLRLKNGRLPEEVPDPVGYFERMLDSLRSRVPPLRVPSSFWGEV